MSHAALDMCVSPAKPESRRSTAVYEEEHQLVPRARGLRHDAMGDISCPQLSKFLILLQLARFYPGRSFFVLGCLGS